MTAPMFEVLGTVRADGTLELDQKLAVPPGRVKVCVEPVAPSAPPAEGLVEYVDRTRRELEAAGHHFMNEEEVTAWVEELRGDEDRIENIYRQLEEEKRLARDRRHDDLLR